MKKLFALLLAACSLLSLAACGAAPQDAAPVNLDLNKIYEDMAAATDEALTPINPDWLLDMYGIDPADCEEAYVYSFNTGMMAAEIWLIEANSPEALSRVKALAESRLSSLDKQSAAYSPALNEVVKKAQIITRGNYLAMILSTNVEALADIFNNAK